MGLWSRLGLSLTVSTLGFAGLSFLGLVLYGGWRALDGGSPSPSAGHTGEDGLEPAQDGSQGARLESVSGSGWGAGQALAPAPPSLAQALALPGGDQASDLSPDALAKVRSIHQKFGEGDYAAALAMADALLDAADTTPALRRWVIEQLPTLLLSIGWTSLKAGDCDTATPHLQRASALKPSPEAAKGLAVCYFRQKNLIAASQQFASYFEYGIKDPVMRLMYADTMESEARYGEAIKILEELSQEMEGASTETQNSGVTIQGLNQRLASMRGRAVAGEEQRAEGSLHFRLSFRSGEHEDLVGWTLLTLEEALDRLVEDYGFRPPPNPIEVLFYQTQQFGSVAVGGPAWADGLFDGRIRVPVRPKALHLGSSGDPELASVLKHELVHALFFVKTEGRPLPTWFDEGMAQRLACPREGCRQNDGATELGLGMGDFLPAATLTAPFVSLNALMAHRAYQQSLFLITVLEELRDSSAIREVVTKIEPGADLSSDGVLSPLGLTFEALRQEAVRRWANQPAAER